MPLESFQAVKCFFLFRSLSLTFYFSFSSSETPQSTYCETVRQHCETIGRKVHVVNLGELR